MTRSGRWRGEAATAQDVAFVAGVLNRTPGPIAGVPVRCRFGRPQVVANFPLTSSGDAPMPTLFWLVCPLLVREVSRLESQGWIRVLGREVASCSEAADAEGRADRLHAVLRRRLLPHPTRRRLRAEAPRLWARLGESGIGGRQGMGVKCLHAHLAHHLALGGGYVGRRVAELLHANGIPLDGSATCGCVEGPERRDGSGTPQDRATVIELGSHSVRALVADRDAGGLRVVEQHLWVSRLGEGLREGRLGGPPLDRTLAAAERLARRARAIGSTRLLVVGTSAVREAANRSELAARVRRATGAALRILDGAEEGWLTFRGALMGLGEPGPAVVIDLGGGSVELAAGSLAAGATEVVSRPWGALRLSRRFGTDTHPAAVRDLVPWLEDQLHRDLASWRGAAEDRILIAVGGTATSLAAMDQGLCRYRPDRVHGYRLPAATLSRWTERLAVMCPEEVRRLPGLQPERAPVILAGAAVLTVLARWLGKPELRVSEWDLMAGLLGTTDPAAAPPAREGQGENPGLRTGDVSWRGPGNGSDQLRE